MPNELTIENATYETLINSGIANSLAKNLKLTDEQVIKANTSLLTLLTDDKLRGASQGSKLRFAYQTATFNYKDPNAIAPINYGGNIQAQLQYQAYLEDMYDCGEVDDTNAVPIYSGVEYHGFINQWGFKQLVIPEKIELKNLFEKKEIIGYYAYAKCKDGRVASCLMSVDELKEHAKRYSKSYKNDSGVWVESFEKMARKTVIKAVARIVLQWFPFDRIAKSLKFDQAVFTEQGVEYQDNPQQESVEAVEQSVNNTLEKPQD